MKLPTCALLLVFFVAACGDEDNPCTRCADNALCTSASATCACPDGYAGDGLLAGTGCANINECTAAQSPCAADASCSDTEGSYTCTCNAGYSGDGRSCADIDECAAGSPCGDVALCRNTAGAYQCRGLFAPSPFTRKVYRLHPTTLATLQTLELELEGATVSGCTSFAEDPTDHTLYAVLKVAGGRVLARADLEAKRYTQLAALSDRFSSIAFDSAGQLFGVTGNGATTPETLYRLDKATGEATLLRALGAGADGEVIQWNPSDGHLYHWSGGTSSFEKISMDETYTITSLSANYNREVFGARWDESTQGFVVFDIASAARRFSTDGTFEASDLATFFDDLRSPGTAVAGEHRATPASGPAEGGTAVTLLGSGFTALGETVTVSFGGTPATGTIVDDTHLTVTSPAVAAGTVSITIDGGDYHYRWPNAFTFTGPVASSRAPRPATAPAAVDLVQPQKSRRAR